VICTGVGVAGSRRERCARYAESRTQRQRVAYVDVLIGNAETIRKNVLEGPSSE
jgi:hypothetical protein